MEDQVFHAARSIEIPEGVTNQRFALMPLAELLGANEYFHDEDPVLAPRRQAMLKSGLF